jgi:hypothetical protein
MAREVRPVRIEGDVAYVPLTQGYEAIIDVQDAEWVRQSNWSAARNQSGQLRAVRGERREEGGKRTVFLHWEILGAVDAIEVIHLNGDTLDNRRSNLAEWRARPIRIDGDVAYIPLTQGYEAIIDAADAEWVG